MEENTFSSQVTPLEGVSLSLDNGATMAFKGRLFSESSFFTEEGALTRQRLYVTENKEHVYSFVAGQGNQKERRAYRIALESASGETICHAHNGKSGMALPLDLLLLAVRGLCGLEDAESSELMESVEETLKAANI